MFLKLFLRRCIFDDTEIIILLFSFHISPSSLYISLKADRPLNLLNRPQNNKWLHNFSLKEQWNEVNFTYIMKTQRIHKLNRKKHISGWSIPKSYKRTLAIWISSHDKKYFWLLDKLSTVHTHYIYSEVIHSLCIVFSTLVVKCWFFVLFQS